MMTKKRMSSEKSTEDQQSHCQQHATLRWQRQKHNHLRCYFPALSYKALICDGFAKNGKSYDNTTISWMFRWWCCILVAAHLVIVTPVLAQPVEDIGLYHQQQQQQYRLQQENVNSNISPPAAAAVVVDSSKLIDGDMAAQFLSSENVQNIEENLTPLEHTGRRQYVSLFPEIDKEVGMIWYPKNSIQIIVHRDRRTDVC